MWPYGLGLDLISSITLMGNVFSDIDTFADINEVVEINNWFFEYQICLISDIIQELYWFAGNIIKS